MLAASTVSGVWPLAAKAHSSVGELQKQLARAQEEADAAKKEADAAKKEADAAKKEAKIRIWVSWHTQSWQGPIVRYSSAR